MTLKTIALNLIIKLVRSLIAGELWARLEALIAQAEHEAADGQTKRAWVLAQLDALPEPLADLVKTTARSLLNLALEALVARLKARLDT